MGKRLRVQAVMDEERQADTRLALSQTTLARTVERAQVVAATLERIGIEEHVTGSDPTSRSDPLHPTRFARAEKEVG